MLLFYESLLGQCEYTTQPKGSVWSQFADAKDLLQLQGVPKKKETFFEHLSQERALNISSKNSIRSKPYNL